MGLLARRTRPACSNQVSTFFPPSLCPLVCSCGRACVRPCVGRAGRSVGQGLGGCSISAHFLFCFINAQDHLLLIFWPHHMCRLLMPQPLLYISLVLLSLHDD